MFNISDLDYSLAEENRKQTAVNKKLEVKNRKLEAENKRLREALERIVDELIFGGTYEAFDTAREALKEE